MPNAGFIDSVNTLRNVFLNGDVKHGEFLENSRKERVIVVAVKLADIFSVKQYASFGRVKKTAHKLHERCFACAVKTDNCKLFTRMNGQVNVRKRVFIRFWIAEGNIIKPRFRIACSVQKRFFRRR